MGVGPIERGLLAYLYVDSAMARQANGNEAVLLIVDPQKAAKRHAILLYSYGGGET